MKYFFSFEPSFLKRCIILMSFFVACISETYAVQLQIGQRTTFSVTAPDGWIDGASWSCTHNEIALESNTETCTVFPMAYFEGTATIECYFSYTYQTWYNGRWHNRTGTSTRHFYVTCVRPSLSISPSNVTLTQGEVTHLKADIVGTSSSEFPMVTWTYSNSTVIPVVDSYYFEKAQREINIEAKYTGTCIITADIGGGITATCNVTVNAPGKPSAINLLEKELTIPIGNSKKLSYGTTPQYATYTLSWKSSAPDIASVDGSGVVTAVAAGKANITVTTDNGKSDQCTITVPPLPTQVSLVGSISLGMGKQYRFSPKLWPDDAVTTYTWNSSDEDVLLVNANGEAKAVGAGQTVVTMITGNGLQTSCTVMVPKPVYALMVLTTNGEQKQFNLAEKPKLTIDDETIKVSSSSTVVEYKGKNIAKFTLKHLNQTAASSSIELPGYVTLMAGESISLKPTLVSIDAESVLTWASDDDRIASVDAKGVVSGLKEGLAVVTLRTTDGIVSNPCYVKVGPDPSGITSVEIDAPSGTGYVYTISGQRLGVPRKGINIIKGKKIVIK